MTIGPERSSGSISIRDSTVNASCIGTGNAPADRRQIGNASHHRNRARTFRGLFEFAFGCCAPSLGRPRLDGHTQDLRQSQM